MLTSASCVSGTGPEAAEHITVLLGGHRVGDQVGVTRASVASILPHPEFNFNSGPYQYDFSLMTLAQPVNFSMTVSPACLPWDVSKDYAGQVATVTGWGLVDYIDYTDTSTLQEVEVTVNTDEDCEEAYSKNDYGFTIDIGE